MRYPVLSRPLWWIECYLALLGAVVRLAMPGGGNLRRRSLRLSGTAAIHPAGWRLVEAIASSFAAAEKRLPCRVGCLARSIALQQVLGWHDIQAALRFGVRRGPEKLDAHAWVEVAGRIVGDTPVSCARYRVLQMPAVRRGS